MLVLDWKMDVHDAVGHGWINRVWQVNPSGG